MQLFMISQLLIAQPVIAIVLKKPPSLIMGLNGHRADNMKWALLDFSFSLSKKQKKVAAEE